MPHEGTETTHLLELVGGGVLLVASVVLWRRRSSQSGGSHPRLQRASPLVGAAIALAEFPTAAPYFVIIVAVVRAHASIAATIALLAAYQLLYLAPVLAISRLRECASGSRRDRVGTFVVRYEDRLVAAIMLAVAVVLVALGSAGQA